MRNLLVIIILLNLLFFGMAGLLAYRINKNIVWASQVLTDLKTESIRETNSKEVKFLLEETEEERARIEDYFVDSASIIAVIEEIESLARRVNVNLTLRSANTNAETPNGPKTLQIDAKMEGKFGDVYRFLSLVERMPYKIFLERASMVTRTASIRTPWEANVTIRITSFRGAE